MLEILALVFGTRHLKNVASNKGQSPWIAAIFPVFWIISELFGALIGTLATGETLVGIVGGLMCALVGGGVAFGIVYALPSRAMVEDDRMGPTGARDIEDNVFA